MFNYGLFKIKKFGTKEQGFLSAIEGTRDIPFEIKRVYYITDVPAEMERGFHSHRQLHQLLICMKGTVTIRIFNGEYREDIKLTQSDVGLYLGPMVWREMVEFSEDCVLTVLASDYYTENDYIRDYEKYLEESKQFFAME